MKRRHNTTFINLQDLSTFTIPQRSSKRQGAAKKKPFIVINTESGQGLLLNNLLAIAKSLGLKEQDRLFRQKEFRSIKFGECIVFGDAPSFSEYDFRIETERESLMNIDKRTWKVYDLISQYKKILKRLQQYAEENQSGYYYPEEKAEVELEIIIEPQRRSSRGVKKSDLNRFKNLIKERDLRYEDITIDDVSVFYNWVKIGYRQYDIYEDEYRREYIQLENGAILWVKEDRYGQRYLAK